MEIVKYLRLQIESCQQFWFQPEKEMNRVLEFETYVRNHRKELLQPITQSDQLIAGKLVIVEIDTCAASAYSRAKILSANFNTGVCRVSFGTDKKKNTCEANYKNNVIFRCG